MAITRITKGVIKPNENYDTHNIVSTGIITSVGADINGDLDVDGHTNLDNVSISGVTTFAGSVNNLVLSGVVTTTELDVNGDADISGNLSVGGVLTYEDVTSIDSIGIITARNDIHVGAGLSVVGVGSFGTVKVGTGVTFETNGQGTFSGIVTSRGYEVSYSDGAITHNYFKAGRIRIFDNGSHCHFRGGEHPSYAPNQRYFSSVVERTNAYYLQNTAATRYGITWTNNDGPVNLYYSKGYAPDYSIKLSTTPIGVTVGSGVTIETNGQANFVGVTTFGNVVGGATTSIVVNRDLVLRDVWGYGNHIKFHWGTNTLNFPSASTANIARVPNLSFGDRTNNGNIIGVGDFLMYHDHYNMHMRYYGANGNLVISNKNTEIQINGANGSGNVQQSIRIKSGSTEGVILHHGGNAKFETAGIGASVYGTLVATGADINGDLDVDGHTNLDNVSIAGVSTYSGAATFNGSVNSNAALNIGANSSINFTSGNWSGNQTKIQNHNNYLYLVAPSNGFQFRIGANDLWLIDTVGNNGTFYPNLDNTRDIGKSNKRIANLYATTLHGSGDFVDLDVDGHTNLDNVSIAGITTTDGQIQSSYNHATNPRIHLTGISAANGYNYLLRGDNNTGSKAVHFVNGSSRTADNGANTYTIRNDNGKLHLGRSTQLTVVQGSTTYLQHGTSTKLYTHNDGVVVNGSGTFSGNVSAVDAIFSGNASIAGVSTFSDNIILPDDKKIQLGDDQDLEIVHDSANGVIRSVNSGGNMHVESKNHIELNVNYNTSSGSKENALKAIANAGVSLFFNGLQKFQTTSTGISVNGGAVLTSTDTGSSAEPEFVLYRNSASPADADYLGQIKFNGKSDTGAQRTYAKITGKILDASNGTEDGIIEFAHIKGGSQNISARFRSDSLQLLNGTALTVAGSTTVTGNIIPSSDSATDIGTNSVRFANIYADTLYGDGSNLTGVTSVGGNTGVDFNDSVKARFGTGNDLELYHNGTDSWIVNNTGYLRINSDNIFIKDGDNGDLFIRCQHDAGVTLYYNNDRKFEILNTGAIVVGTLSATTFSGSGASLTSIPAGQLTGALPAIDGSNLTGISGVTINSNADNRIITGSGTAATLNGESNLTYNGSNLALSGNDNQYITIGASADLTLKADGQNSAIVHSGDGDLVILAQGSNENIRIGSTGHLQFQTGGSNDRVRITSGGRLLIGTTTSNISGSFSAVVSTGAQSNNGGFQAHYNAGSYGGGSMTTVNTDGGGLDFWTYTGNLGSEANYNRRLRIDSSGRVLIGTTTEGHAAGDNLTVADSGNAGITIRSGSSSNGVVYFSDGTSGSAEYRGAVQYNHTDNYLRFYTNGDEKLRITSGGHISQGGGAEPSSTNGAIGLKHGIKSSANNVIIGETTQSGSGYGLHIESRQTGRSGSARIAQIGMKNDSSGNGQISFFTSPSGADVSERMVIDSAGQVLPGADDSQNLGSSTKRWKNIYAADMHFSNKGKTNDVDGTWGDWTLQEGEDSVFMINNRTGKKYAITMKEVN